MNLRRVLIPNYNMSSLYGLQKLDYWVLGYILWTLVPVLWLSFLPWFPFIAALIVTINVVAGAVLLCTYGVLVQIREGARIEEMDRHAKQCDIAAERISFPKLSALYDR